MKVILIGDIVGNPGREVLVRRLPSLKREVGAEFVVANVENAAGGAGVTRPVCEEILGAGVDVMTSGNHIYDKKDVLGYIGNEPRLLRPANYSPDSPGRGMWLGSTISGTQVAVINVQGRVFMPPTDCPFNAVDRLLAEVGNRARVIIVDVHAEATSEKLAMGRHLDGRVSAVVGTHTHVQTSDEQLLPGATAYITDLGMTGPHSGIIGVKSELVLTRFLKAVPARFETAEADATLNGVVIDVNERDGRASSIDRVSLK